MSIFSALSARAQREVDLGLPFGGVEGCALAVAKDGDVLFEAGFGKAEADTPFLLLSVTKTVFEAALLKLWSDGVIHPDMRVAEILPDFAQNGKAGITIAHLQTHTCCLASHDLAFPQSEDRVYRRASICGWSKDEGSPGESYSYHIGSAHWVLAEIVETVTGRDYRRYLREDILAPLGLDDIRLLSLGLPEAEHDRTLIHRNFMFGYRPDPATEEPMLLGYSTRRGLALGNPGSGAVGTARGVTLLWQEYLHNRHGLFDPDLLACAREEVRFAGTDGFGRPMRRSLSFILAGEPQDRWSERAFFGRKVSARSFGHQGQGGQVAWADPETGISFAFLSNTVTFPPNGYYHPRGADLSDLAASLVL